jgi:hypothetical protein
VYQTVASWIVAGFEKFLYGLLHENQRILLFLIAFILFIVDTNSNPSGGFSAGSPSPLLLILGYVNGIHIWMIPVNS